MSTRQASVRSRAGKFKLAITATIGAAHVGYLRKHLLAAWPLIENAPAEFSLAIVNDTRMAFLHRQFLKIDGPTDVLTFELDHNNAGECTAGEVIICLPEAQRRADERESPVRTELLLYAVHGLLHLAGFDDKTPAAYRAMHRKEDEILSTIGVGPVFADKPGTSAATRRKRRN